MDITTTEGRAALRAMLAEATPGPWSYSEKNEDDVQRPYRHGPQVVYADADCDIHPVADCSCNHTCRDEREAAANGIAIAAAINTLPTLLDALEAAERRIAALTAPATEEEAVVACFGARPLITQRPVQDALNEFVKARSNRP